MPAEPKPPFTVSLSQTLVRVAAQLVPRADREDWIREWHAEIWHRWRFLFSTGAWNPAEQFRLIRSSLGAFADSGWILASQQALQNRVREVARSPYTCLYTLAAMLLLIAIFSSGMPAARELFFGHSGQKMDRLTFIWQHPFVGGGDKGLPPDVVPAWASRSKLLEKVAGFEAHHLPVSINSGPEIKPLVITTNATLFQILEVRPTAGRIPGERGAILDHNAWISWTKGSPRALGSKIQVAKQHYVIAAILPQNFQFLSRQPAVYVVDNPAPHAQLYVLAQMKPGVSEKQLDRELTKIAEDVCYYFLQGQIRYSSWRMAMLTPLFGFVVALSLSGGVLLLVFGPRMKQIRAALLPRNRKAALHRGAFFAGKAVLALAAIFSACLEWSRSESSVLLASRDPGSGPFLIWLYVLGTMGVLFWAIADHRARCRVCLRLLAFPVRIGCPGCLLLDWSGTELLCSEGHGILHVPHLAPSWDEQSDHWISLDESWKGLFANEK